MQLLIQRIRNTLLLFWRKQNYFWCLCRTLDSIIRCAFAARPLAFLRILSFFKSIQYKLRWLEKSDISVRRYTRRRWNSRGPAVSPSRPFRCSRQRSLSLLSDKVLSKIRRRTHQKMPKRSVVFVFKIISLSKPVRDTTQVNYTV